MGWSCILQNLLSFRCGMGAHHRNTHRSSRSRISSRRESGSLAYSCPRRSPKYIPKSFSRSKLCMKRGNRSPLCNTNTLCSQCIQYLRYRRIHCKTYRRSNNHRSKNIFLCPSSSRRKFLHSKNNLIADCFGWESKSHIKYVFRKSKLY